MAQEYRSVVEYSHHKALSSTKHYKAISQTRHFGAKAVYFYSYFLAQMLKMLWC